MESSALVLPQFGPPGHLGWRRSASFDANRRRDRHGSQQLNEIPTENADRTAAAAPDEAIRVAPVPPGNAAELAIYSRLIERIAAHQDREAYRTLFAFFAPRIRAMLRRSGCNAEASEDLAQEALLTVWRKAHFFDASRASASTWIYTIARNLRIDVARREKRAQMHAIAEQNEPEPDLPDQPDELVDLAARQARVHDALKILPPEQLQVVTLSFVEGKAHSEIAEELGIPMGTVKSRMRLAMARLRPVLGDLK